MLEFHNFSEVVVLGFLQVSLFIPSWYSSLLDIYHRTLQQSIYIILILFYMLMKYFISVYANQSYPLLSRLFLPLNQCMCLRHNLCVSLDFIDSKRLLSWNCIVNLWMHGGNLSSGIVRWMSPYQLLMHPGRPFDFLVFFPLSCMYDLLEVTLSSSICIFSWWNQSRKGSSTYLSYIVGISGGDSIVISSIIMIIPPLKISVKNIEKRCRILITSVKDRKSTKL